MHYVKISTNDGETRWINLAQVSRFTMATDQHEGLILVIVFADASSENKLEIRATDETNRKAIAELTSCLDSVAINVP